MSRTLLSATAAFVGLFLMTASAVAQDAHVVTDEELSDMVAERAAEATSSREALRTFLRRSDVRDIATAYGIDVVRAEHAVATLSDAEAQELASRAREVEKALGGAGSVTITYTAIIIGLLVLIVLILVL